MARVGILLDATAAEFIAWFEGWTQRSGQPVYEVAQGKVQPGSAEQHIVLGQHLTLEVPGALVGASDVPVGLPSLLTFQVLPVGLGTSIVVLGTSNLPELAPCLAEFSSAASARWHGSETSDWFGESHDSPIELCKITLPARIQTLEGALAGFATSMATPLIRSVSFFPAAEARTPHGTARWALRLSLSTAGPWQGIDHIKLDCHVRSTPGSHFLQVTLGCQGFVYREAEQFVSALVAYCQSQWPDAKVSYPAKLRQAATAEPPADPRRLLSPSSQRGWTLTDRPWDLVADTGWDRRLLELWWRNYPGTVIGRQLGVSPKRVLNRISELRRKHGSGVVPTEMQRRGKNWEQMGDLGS